jgi:hypothetical protein
MNIRAIREGNFVLPLPVAAAVPLFTPEGGTPFCPRAIQDKAGLERLHIRQASLDDAQRLMSLSVA